MHSLSQEIAGFSKRRLKKRDTLVTTVMGVKHIETRSRHGEEYVEKVEEFLEEEEEEGEKEGKKKRGSGFVEDTSLDLQVGVVRPFLLLGSQDAAHDIDTLRRHKVSHVLNVAYGVTNLFEEELIYKSIQILDLPETDITAYLEECCGFIEQAKEKNGVVLVHCNAGVSRASSVVIGYLMLGAGLTFDDAYRQVKEARPSIRPNPGFYKQLQNYKP